MNLRYAKRALAMLAVSALSCVPVKLCYGRLDTSRVPEELAKYAVPAYRYELATPVYDLASLRNPDNAEIAADFLAAGDDSKILSCYDRAGRELRRILVSDSYTHNTYRLDGKKVRRYLKLKQDSTDTRYFYDAQGRPLETIQYGIGDRVSKTHFSYDGNSGTAVQETSGYPYRLSSSTTTYTTDENGQALSMDRLIGGMRYHTDYFYDEYNNLVRTETSGGGKRSVSEWNYVYNDDGQTLSLTFLIDGEPRIQQTFRYGEDGRLLSGHSAASYPTDPDNPGTLGDTTTDIIYEDVTLR